MLQIIGPWQSVAQAIQLTDDDLIRLSAHESFFTDHAYPAAGLFVEHVMQAPGMASQLADPAIAMRFTPMQAAFFTGLGSDRLVQSDVEQLERIGAVHARIGLEEQWVMAATGAYYEYVLQNATDFDANTLISLVRRLRFCEIVMVHTYVRIKSESVSAR
ncbi:MAG: protoglobin domain-containing protein [Firmicutes bacterium]|nr:protoglobin domain-containing protein [Bacillota bacterium]